MTKLGELYSNFSRIDLDTRGGYARVCQVKTTGQKGHPEYCAFKLMRHEIDHPQKGLEHFEDELKILLAISNDTNAPATITRIHDSGFVSAELSHSLHKSTIPDLNTEIISTGKDLKIFQSEKKARKLENWLPYITVDLASYDDSLLRQIHNQPNDNPSSLFRLPTGEVILMAIQLLETMKYLHETHYRIYLDWKPEHIFWNGLSQKVKLIDWNVTVALNESPGEAQNIRDDLRLFCGAVLYIPLAFVDPDDPTKPIGPRPTKDILDAIPEIRHRYLTENPDFYQRDVTLDSDIKEIVKKGLSPKKGFNSIKELTDVLKNYSIHELGLNENDFTHHNETKSPYFEAIKEMRLAQKQLIQAQQHLIDAVKANGKRVEFTRLFDEIKRALINFPAS